MGKRKKSKTPQEFYDRASELRSRIRDADYDYYVLSKPTLSDREYDKLYYELMLLERDFPSLRSDMSPTQRVGSDLVDGFEKSEHIQPMLSMDKIKAEDFREGTKLRKFLSKTKNRYGYTGQWKCDGLTLVLTYKNGKLEKAVTRGDGYVGDDVTVNAKTIRNLPLYIGKHIDMTVRGEVMISKKDFDYINSQLEVPFVNARNLASGSLKNHDTSVCRERRLMFFAYDVIDFTLTYDAVDSNSNLMDDYEASRIHGCLNQDNISNDETWLGILKMLKFAVVPYCHIDTFDDFQKYIEDLEFDFDDLQYNIDGAVFKCNDYDVRRSLGNGTKYPNWAFSFKFDDDIFETKLLDIEWDVSRTRRINPVAILEPVVIDGTTVDRATLNNPDYIKELELGIGDNVGLIKANMIIPNIVENYTRSDSCVLPTECPVCGSKLWRKGAYLYCTNVKCYGANLHRFRHFCSKGAMNIKGLSTSKLFDLLENNIVSEFYDLYSIEKHKKEIVSLEGWGRQSYNNLYMAIQESRVTTLPRFIYALGIPNIGYESAVVLCDYVQNDPLALLDLTYNQVIELDGFGDKTTRVLIKYLQSKRIRRIINTFVSKHILEFDDLADAISIDSDVLEGKVFCITGKLSKPRDYFADDIVANGGEFTSSIKKNTTHLLYGKDAGSKLEKAKEKGLVLVTEDEYNKMVGRFSRPNDGD